MPVIPAWLVRRCLDDPRKIPYLLVWKDERHDGAIMEAVRLTHGGSPDLVELKRTDGSTTVLRIVWRMLPRNGGRALLLLCSLLQHAAPSRLWLGMGQRFGMVEQSQER